MSYLVRVRDKSEPCHLHQRTSREGAGDTKPEVEAGDLHSGCGEVDL
ncbi:hypothetical protein [Caudoviricetes sp.]|nr:hypothetical protein [Caudoviricetes sp.]